MKQKLSLLFLSFFMSCFNIMAQTPSPALYLNFNNNLNDQSGNQLNVTGVDYSFSISECDSNSVYVNGTLNDPYSYIEVEDNALLKPSRKLTVAAWAKYMDTDRSILYCHVASKRYDYFNPPYNSYGIFVNNFSSGNKKWYAEIGNNSGIHSVASQDTALIGEWTHIAMTFNDSILSLYINGQFQNSTVIASENIVYSNLPLYLGTSRPNGGNTQFKGNIDEVYVFDEVLSEALIQDLANCTPITSSVNIVSEVIPISVFPNPANSILFISGLEGEQIKEIEIYNSLGQTVIQGSNIALFEGIDISNLQHGLYFINLKTESNKISKQSFTVLK